MLVYSNHLSFQGGDAEGAIFKAIGAWLKEQLGFGLHPDQLRKDGEFSGNRGEVRSSVRIYAITEEDPHLYAWVLRNADERVRGRQWITELGLKLQDKSVEFSCVVKTDEQSTLVASPVMASRPRVIGYIDNNIQKAQDADFAASVSAVSVKSVGEDYDSYRGLLAEFERRERDCPIVIVSPTREGEYLLDVVDLQQKLVGLGQVVQVSRGFNSYEMAEVIGQPRAAWSGAINRLDAPTQTGFVRSRLFLSEEIVGWGTVNTTVFPSCWRGLPAVRTSPAFGDIFVQKALYNSVSGGGCRQRDSEAMRWMPRSCGWSWKTQPTEQQTKPNTLMNWWTRTLDSKQTFPN